ncbi:hypothetical protein CEP52_009118 [Fusarium oligoseptatum]|uniref:DUF7908 domain-containing protein n=1 Tax=Fusarium oligoseptatum TaxID=2604345 RepID=A0A428TEH5_9HYPO|nr:hypothetical protein CEP52_009118 [Fusarium oligoseptatum]
MRPGLVLAAIGSVINIADAADLVKDGDPTPASWCITYLSTYLAPVSMRPAFPGSSDTSTTRIGPSLVSSVSGTSLSGNLPSSAPSGTSSTEEQQLPDSSVTSIPLSSVTSGPLPSISSGTLLPTDAVSSDPVSTATAGPNPGGRIIIFQVIPSTDPEKRDLSKRALGGYVASGGTVNPDVCTDADTFTLTSGQLLDNDIPIYYDGEEFKLFGGQGPPPDDAITTTFENVGGSLRWVNPSLPNGQAGFCQVAASGQVYITFSSRPEGCRPVTISVFTVEQCLNGELDARVPSDSTSATTANPTGVPSSGVGTSQVTVSTNTVDSTESPESSELPATLPGESTSSKASPASTSSKVSSVSAGSGTAVPDDVSSSIVRTQSTDGPPSVETSTDRNPPTSSRDDTSLTNAPSTTSPLSEPTSSATDSSDTDLSTSDLPATDSSSTFTESPSSAELSSSLASTDFSLDPTIDLSFSATSYEASSTGSLPITDGTTSSAPRTTEPSTTESLDSSSSETTVSTEPASSSSDSDTTTSEDTTTSPDTTTSEPTTTTSAEVEPTVLFASDDLNGHQGEYREISTSFPVYMYDAFSQILTVSVNGIIVLGSQVIDSSPHTSLPAQSLLYAVLPYWTENTILPFTQQGITYRTLGTAPERTLVIEFKVTPAIRGEPVIPDHYTVTFFENRQRYCVVRYFRTEGKGSDATIGNQLQSPIPFNEFSYNEPSAIDDNKELTMTLEESGVFTYN